MGALKLLTRKRIEGQVKVFPHVLPLVCVRTFVLCPFLGGGEILAGRAVAAKVSSAGTTLHTSDIKGLAKRQLM